MAFYATDNATLSPENPPPLGTSPFWTQQHGDNTTWEVSRSRVRD